MLKLIRPPRRRPWESLWLTRGKHPRKPTASLKPTRPYSDPSYSKLESRQPTPASGRTCLGAALLVLQTRHRHHEQLLSSKNVIQAFRCCIPDLIRRTVVASPSKDSWCLNPHLSRTRSRMSGHWGWRSFCSSVSWWQEGSSWPSPGSPGSSPSLSAKESPAITSVRAKEEISMTDPRPRCAGKVVHVEVTEPQSEGYWPCNDITSWRIVGVCRSFWTTRRRVS